MSGKNNEVTSTDDRSKVDSTTDENIARILKATKEATDVANTVAEPYRVKCFEVLLSYFLTGKTTGMERVAQPTLISQTPQKPEIRTEVKALLMQYSIPEDIVTKKFFVDGKIMPHYRLESPEKMKTAKLQVVYAVLLALENALRTGKFEFSVEEVRNKCKEAHRLDRNFSANLKNNDNLFGSFADSEHVALSSDGKTELADVLLALK